MFGRKMMTGFPSSRGTHASEEWVGAALRAVCPQYHEAHQQVCQNSYNMATIIRNSPLRLSSNLSSLHRSSITPSPKSSPLHWSGINPAQHVPPPPIIAPLSPVWWRGKEWGYNEWQEPTTPPREFTLGNIYVYMKKTGHTDSLLI